jgi:CubicO group peptidase (beta-lactamase class C family)
MSAGYAGGYALAIRAADGSSTTYATGLAVIEHGVPFGQETVVNAGSIAKQFTAALAFMAVRSSLLELTDPVRRWLPNAGLPATVRVLDLLQHTSGIRDAEKVLALFGMREYDYVSRDDLINLLRGMDLMFEPGCRFSYSNSNYLLLGLIIERVLGGTLDVLVAERVCSPLGLTRTHVAITPDAVIPGLAHAYLIHPRRAVVRADRPSSIAGASSLYSCVPDLLRWGRQREAVIYGDSSTAVDRGLTAMLAANKAARDYGPGLSVENVGTTKWLYHAGHEHGFSAETYSSSEGELVACTTNSAHLDAARISRAAVRDLRGSGSVETALAAALREVSAAPHEAADPTIGREPDVASYDGVAIGLYECASIPLPLRIDRDSGGGLVVRRGPAAERLRELDSGSFAGPGYQVTFPSSYSRKNVPDEFRIFLPRAGTFVFQRRKTC